MKAFDEPRAALTAQAGLILLFVGEVGPASAEPRRAQPNRYPDFGHNLTPAFPSRPASAERDSGPGSL